MTIVNEITVLILTKDEEANLAATLAGVAWARQILIVDSGSRDQTLDIARQYPQVRIIHHPFDSFAEQCNFGLQNITTEWTMSLDADYKIGPDLAEEISQLAPQDEISGYFVKFWYAIYGARLGASLYPPRCALYRTRRAHYRNEGHGHRVGVEGKVGSLSARIVHDDRKPLSRWLASQLRYADREADFLLSAKPSELKPVDRIRALAWPMPILAFFYTLLIKRCLFQGLPGWHYTLQRTLAETVIALALADRRLRSRLEREEIERGLDAKGG